MIIAAIIISVIVFFGILGRSTIERLTIPDKVNSHNPTLKKGLNRVEFESKGKKIVANVFIPEDYKEGEKRPGIVVAPPATSLKEHAA